MRKVALLYNPASGQYQSRRKAVLENVLAVLRNQGIEATALATSAPGSAGEQIREAVRGGADTILACGGDGTIHEALQVLVGTPVALGVVPMGTANALACDLGLPISPVEAVEMLLKARPEQIPVGRVTYRAMDGTERSRYFTVAAGIGADAHLMYRLDARLKRRFGYALYVVEALRIWLGHSFPYFEARIQTQEESNPEWQQISQLLAVRISDFGGILHHLIPGAALHNRTISLVSFRTRSRWRYLLFTLAVLFGRQGNSSAVKMQQATVVECRFLNGSNSRIFVEADGELLGGMPVKIEIATETLTLLMPSNTSR
jgi:YegS/Rv2252/BmrU family lipid kinase